MRREISYKCLNCDHSFNVDSFRMNANHCPNCKCKVSITKIDRECEHKYRLMDSKTTQIQADNRQVSIHILGSFYCEKCLDIQFRGKIEEGE
ncbi:hypothetical protein COL00_26635 [Bacillus cereus]|nr:hypothetical protein COL00_26635 [Bacillus cereus]